MNRIILLILLFLTIFISTSYAVTDSFQPTKWYVVTNNSVYMNEITGSIYVPQKTNNQYVYLQLECSGQEDVYVHINISYKSTNTTWSYINENRKILCSPAGTVNTIKIPINFVNPGNYIFNINISNNYCDATGCYVLSTSKIKVSNIESYFKEVESNTGVVANFNSYITDSFAFTVSKSKFNLLTSFGKFSMILFILLAFGFIVMYFKTKEKRYLILAFALFIVAIISKLATIYMYPQYSFTVLSKNGKLISPGFYGTNGEVTDHVSWVSISIGTSLINDTINKTSSYIYETSDYVITYNFNLDNVSHDYNTVKEIVDSNQLYLNFPLGIRSVIPVSNTSTLLGCVVTKCTTSNGKCNANIILDKTSVMHNIAYGGILKHYGGRALVLWIKVYGKNQEYSVSPMSNVPVIGFITSHFTAISYQVLPSQVEVRVNCVFRKVKAIPPNTSIKQLPTINLDKYVKENLNQLANKDNNKLNNKNKKKQDLVNYMFFGAMIIGVLLSRKRKSVKH